MEGLPASVSMAEGVARILEKFVEAAYARQVDDVRLTTSRVASGPQAPAAASPVPLSSIPQEDRAVVERLLRQEVSRTAFRKVYRDRMRQSQERLAALEAGVESELARMQRPQVTIGVRGREDTQITIASKEAARAAAAGPAAASAAASAVAAPPAPPVTKTVLRRALVQATQRAMDQLGLDGEQAYRAAFAVHAAGHPQLRALVIAALPEVIERERNAAEERRRIATRAAESGEGARQTSSSAFASSALGRAAPTRRRASALVVKIKTRKSSGARA